MTPIAEILPTAHQMSLEQLQQHKNERDAIVQQMREEMRLIHYQMEPKFIQEMRNGAAPGNLSQVMQVGNLPTAFREEQK